MLPSNQAEGTVSLLARLLPAHCRGSSRMYFQTGLQWGVCSTVPGSHREATANTDTVLGAAHLDLLPLGIPGLSTPAGLAGYRWKYDFPEGLECLLKCYHTCLEALARWASALRFLCPGPIGSCTSNRTQPQR